MRPRPPSPPAAAFPTARHALHAQPPPRCSARGHGVAVLSASPAPVWADSLLDGLLQRAAKRVVPMALRVDAARQLVMPAQRFAAAKALRRRLAARQPPTRATAAIVRCRARRRVEVALADGPEVALPPRPTRRLAAWRRGQHLCRARKRTSVLYLPRAAASSPLARSSWRHRGFARAGRGLGCVRGRSSGKTAGELRVRKHRCVLLCMGPRRPPYDGTDADIKVAGGMGRPCAELGVRGMGGIATQMSRQVPRRAERFLERAAAARGVTPSRDAGAFKSRSAALCRPPTVPPSSTPHVPAAGTPPSVLPLQGPKSLEQLLLHVQSGKRQQTLLPAPPRPPPSASNHSPACESRSLAAQFRDPKADERGT
eukprot:365856-Chlamydomonas_euryale.AAC.22